MKTFGFILMIAGGIMVMATFGGGISYAVGFWGFVAIIAGYLIERETH